MKGDSPVHKALGYIADFNMWIHDNNPIIEQFYNTLHTLPDISFEDLVELVRRIQLQGNQL
jgi:hypothetical protein